MKNFLFLTILIFTSQVVLSQVTDGVSEYNKKSQQAVIGEYKYPEETVEKALEDKLARKGLKTKSSKGFLLVNEGVINDITATPMDYAFKVERKSRREKDVTTVTMIMRQKDINMMAMNSSAAKTFLFDLAPVIDSVNTDMMINDQYETVVKMQKKYKDLQDDQTGLEKKIRKLQDDLAENAKAQSDQQRENGRQQEILDAWKAKKTN